MIENERTLNLENFKESYAETILKLCNVRNIRIRREEFWCLQHRGRGNETHGKMGPMGSQDRGGNVSNATESPWPEAWAVAGWLRGCVVSSADAAGLQDYFPEIFATDFKTRNALPFVHYNGCTMAAIPEIRDDERFALQKWQFYWEEHEVFSHGSLARSG